MTRETKRHKFKKCWYQQYKKKLLVASFTHGTSTHYRWYRKINIMGKVDGGLSPKQSGILNLMQDWVMKKRDRVDEVWTHMISSTLYMHKEKGKFSLIFGRCWDKTKTEESYGRSLQCYPIWQLVAIKCRSRCKSESSPRWSATCRCRCDPDACAWSHQKIYLHKRGCCTHTIENANTKSVFSVSSPTYGTLIVAIFWSHCTHLL